MFEQVLFAEDSVFHFCCAYLLLLNYFTSFTRTSWIFLPVFCVFHPSATEEEKKWKMLSNSKRLKCLSDIKSNKFDASSQCHIAISMQSIWCVTFLLLCIHMNGIYDVWARIKQCCCEHWTLNIEHSYLYHEKHCFLFCGITWNRISEQMKWKGTGIDKERFDRNSFDSEM